MEKNLVVFHKDYSPMFPARVMKDSLLDLHCEILVGFLVVKLMKVWSPSKTRTPGVSDSP